MRPIAIQNRKKRLEMGSNNPKWRLQYQHEYQQAVINYQNHNGFEDEGQLPSRRSSIWNKQPSANSIWNMTDD